jgi:hypothetical protein
MLKAIHGAIGAVWLCSVAASQTMWVARVMSPIASNSAEITAQAKPGVGEVIRAPRVEDRDLTDPRVDLLGNEVENAVADYRIDRGGSVYERHSPETAVARLGSPTS